MIKIYGDSALVRDANIGGTPDLVLAAWWAEAKGMKSNEADAFNGVATLEVGHVESVTIGEVVYAVSKGFEVENMELVIEMTEAKYDNQVIAGVPNRTVTDEEGNETVLKWNEWKKPNMKHYHIGDKYYIPTNAGIKTRYMKGSEFINVHGKTGYKLLTMAEFAALQPSGE